MLAVRFGVTKKPNTNLQRRICSSRNLPAGNVFGCVTSLCLLVVHLSDLAAEITRLHTVQADVKPLAVGRVGVLRVRHNLSGLVRLLILRAGESILQFLCNDQRYALGRQLWWNPVTNILLFAPGLQP